MNTISRRTFLSFGASLLAGAMMPLSGPAQASPFITCASSSGLPSFISPEGWSGRAWNSAIPILQKILAHPFVTGLADGSLPRDIFAFYILQDACYLESYARTLAAIAKRLPRQDQRDLMAGFIRDTLAAEQYMHELYQSWSGKTTASGAPSPTCQLYMSYEARLAATAPMEVACAVILPCFTVYQQVGNHLLASRTKGANPYSAWIDAYADPSFETATRSAAALCDELADKASADVRKEMTDAYVLATRMEWMFWDSAYRMEQWPI